MKRILTIVCAIAISLLSASAQEKQHSLEITTGYPSILHNAEYPWAYSTVEMTWNGQTYKEHYQPGINIGYTYQWRKRWEVNTMVNVVNGNQKCSDFGNSECSIFGIKTTVLFASAVQ